MSSGVTWFDRPSEHSRKQSPASTASVMMSGLTDCSKPTERVMMFRNLEVSASSAVSSPARTCSAIQE